jgi:hypothetical protein
MWDLVVLKYNKRQIPFYVVIFFEQLFRYPLAMRKKRVEQVKKEGQF